jgi:DNA-binding MarR family transcriptional regulator
MQTTTDQFNPLLLENQLCFPLYAASKEVTKRYKPFLDPLGLTYTQYIVMMALWEHDNVAVRELGDRVLLDSATLTPLLKRLESRGYITRTRSEVDERSVIIALTDEGRDLRERALSVPKSLGGCIHLEKEEATALKQLLEKLLATLE